MKINILPYSFVNKILPIVILLVVTVILSYFIVRFGAIVFIAVSLLSILLIVVLYILKHHPATLIILVILTLPLQPIFLTKSVTQLTAQLSILLVVYYYWKISPLKVKYEYLRKIKPLIFPTLAFGSSFFISYLVSRELGIKDWVFLLKLIGSVGYAYLACFYCNSLKNIKRVLWAFVAIGVIQLPIIYAQAQKWTDNLPGALVKLSSFRLTKAFNPNMIRFPGMFGDYELVAEYFVMMVLICAGFLIFNFQKKEKIIALLSILTLITAGFYTGTRAFIWGMGGGLLVMLFFMLIRPGFGKNLINLLIIGLVLWFVIILLSKQDVFANYIDRILNTVISLNYYDSRDIVFKMSISLIPKMPFFGYGPSLMQEFNRTSSWKFFSPHSLYFSMLLMNGYPGLIAIFVMVFTPIIWFIKLLFKNNTKTCHAWAIIFLSTHLFWTVNEIKIEFIRQSFYMNIIFFMLGIMASFYDVSRNNFKNSQIQVNG